MVRRLASALALILALSSCASERPVSKPEPLSNIRCKQTAPTTLSKGGGLKVVSVAKFRADGDVRSLITWDNYLAWTMADRAGKLIDRAMVCDLRTGHARVVARPRPEWSSEGLIESIRGSRETVVYVEQEHSRTFGGTWEEYGTPWAVWEVDLQTGRKRMLAASASPKEEPYEPRPVIEWPWVVWGAPPSECEDLSNLVAYDLRTRKLHQLVPCANSGFFAIDGGIVFYNAIDPPESNLAAVLAVPVDGSAPPRRLTDSGRAIWPKAESGSVTWQEQPEGPPNWEDPKDDSPWVLPVWHQGPPIRLAEEGNNVYPGKGFVIWLGWLHEGQPLVARDPFSHEEPVVLEEVPDLGPRWSTFEDRAVWVSFVDWENPDKGTIIHVARLLKG